MQRPRLVLRVGDLAPAVAHREQPPARGQEVGEAVELVGSVRRTDPDAHPAVRVPGARPAALAVVRHLVVGDGQAHPRPEVRQAEPGARDRHGAEPGCVEREEPHPAAAGRVAHVGAHVRLAERRRVRQRRADRRGHAHEERHEAHPGPAVSLLDLQRLREQALHDLGRVGTSAGTSAAPSGAASPGAAPPTGTPPPDPPWRSAAVRGTNGRSVRPTYTCRGRPILVIGSAIISRHCAIQPGSRPSANSTVNIGVGNPIAL